MDTIDYSLPVDNIDVLLGGYRGYLAWSEYFRKLNDNRFRFFFLNTPGEEFDISLRNLSVGNSSLVLLSSHKELSEFFPADIALCIGWRYMLPNTRANVFVVHDSLLPKLRGWNPAVTALQNGDQEVGLTLFRASEKPDAGPILSQVRIATKDAAKIADVLHDLAKCYAELFDEFVRAKDPREMDGVFQNEESVSFSLWRDNLDQFIDWSDSSQAILRFINSLSWPYTGARTNFNKTEIVVLEAKLVGDTYSIVNRVPGKVISIIDSMPVVVCGEGLLLLNSVKDLDGLPMNFSSVRIRFT